MLAALMDKMLKSARPDDTPAQPAKGWFRSCALISVLTVYIYVN